MLRPANEKWHQSEQELYRMSLEAEHPRSRERYHALYMIASGQSNASQWAQRYGRHKQTVMSWVHLYNAQGPEGIVYERTGGRPPFLAQNRRR